MENDVNKGDTGNRKFFPRSSKISEQFAFVSVTYCAAGGDRCQKLVVNKSPVIN